MEKKSDSLLVKFHLVSKATNKAAVAFESVCPNFLSSNEAKKYAILYDGMLPHVYVSNIWFAFKRTFRSSQSNSQNNVNGKVFELIIYTLLIREHLLPLYTQAKVHYVPNVDFDAILYVKPKESLDDNKNMADICEYPICLSMKTTPRERYKQASLEAQFLKLVHRNAKCYLLLTEGCNDINKKIQKAYVVGLDFAYNCVEDPASENYYIPTPFDDLISAFKKKQLGKAGEVSIIDTDPTVMQEDLDKIKK